MKQGIDDFLVAKGKRAKEEFAKLIQVSHAIETDGERIPVIKIINPPTLGEAAYHGFIGAFLRSVAPYTEAPDAGVLAHLLSAIGTLIGPLLYIFAGGKQPARVNSVIVGPTNAGRKGTSLVPVDLLMEKVDADFWHSQRVGGLSSGEGLIARVADREEKGQDGTMVVITVEKRLFVVEEEFSRVLAQIRREANILSQIIRSAFDGGTLSTLTVKPRHAIGVHISIVAHVTPEELEHGLEEVEMANGFGNRFLWWLVKSDKIMPRTKPIPENIFDKNFIKRLQTLAEFGKSKTEHSVRLDKPAEQFWEQLYPKLREDRPGLAGAMVSRGSVMVLRLALIYAAVDTKKIDGLKIEVQHLKAALAIWEYTEASADNLFQSETGDKFSDKILTLLNSAPMTRDELNRHLSPKQKKTVDFTLKRLESLELIMQSKVSRQGAGRPATRWERVRAK